MPDSKRKTCNGCWISLMQCGQCSLTHKPMRRGNCAMLPKRRGAPCKLRHEPRLTLLVLT